MQTFQPLKALVEWLLLPLLGIGTVLALWAIASATFAPDLPSPARTWEESRPYVVEPFAYRGELDQGIGRFTWLSLKLVVQGYVIALLVGTPLGFMLGSSKAFGRAFDPVFQVLRPVSPLAWLPLGLVIFSRAGTNISEFAAIFTIAVCAMWPTVLNTAVGVRAIPQDYHNVAKVLRLSRAKTLFKVLIPATLPYMFTGFRLSLGIAWLVIVAAEMLTGRPGIGGFLWQEYNSLIYSHILLCIIVIGTVGFLLDRMMSVIEMNLSILIGTPGRAVRWLRAGRADGVVAAEVVDDTPRRVPAGGAVTGLGGALEAGIPAGVMNAKGGLNHAVA